MAQEVSQVPNISIGFRNLDLVNEFTCLGSTISANLLLDVESNRRIFKVWEKQALHRVH